MINRDRIGLWVKALRSGEFVQGSGTLENEGIDAEGNPVKELCCLGVACRVAMRNGLNLPITTSPNSHLTFFGENRATGFLPDEVQEWYGFDNDNPWIGTGQNLVRAVDANDGRGFSFNTIATLVEDRYINEQEVKDNDEGEDQRNP